LSAGYFANYKQHALLQGLDAGKCRLWLLGDCRRLDVGLFGATLLRLGACSARQSYDRVMLRRDLIGTVSLLDAEVDIERRLCLPRFRMVPRARAPYVERCSVNRLLQTCSRRLGKGLHLATIEKRGPSQYRARVRRAGVDKPITRTFESKLEAEKWARRLEADVDAGKRILFLATPELQTLTLRSALERYRDEKTVHKAGAPQERNRIGRWLKHPLAEKLLHQIVPGDLEQHRDQRLAEGKAFATVRHELDIISQVYEAARFSWRMRDLENPMKHIKRPPAWANPRNIRLKGTVDLRTFLAAVAPTSKHCTKAQREAATRCALALEFAIETSLRRGEVAAITPAHTNFNEHWVEVGREGMLHGHLKGGTRRVALSSRAIQILKSLEPRNPHSSWFGVSARTLSAAVLRARHKLGIGNLRLHDFRHEATSALFEKGLTQIEVSTMTGHKSLTTLKRYTHPDISEIAKKLG
jgi:integrase